MTWELPYSGATPITSYEVKFLSADGLTYFTELSYCSGSNSAIKDARSCVVPSEVFTQVPFSLEWGQSIFATVDATNIKGTSEVSAAGNGAIILRVPDSPINLENVPSLTDFDSIGLNWADGSENGGAPVLDYRVSYKNNL